LEEVIRQTKGYQDKETYKTTEASKGSSLDEFGEVTSKKKAEPVNIENINLINKEVESFVKKYENFEYGDKAGSKGEDNKIDCSGLVCEYIDTKGLSEEYKSDKSSQGLWTQSKNKK